MLLSMMMDILIKVIKDEVANELIESGFTYMTENHSGKTVYVFVLSPELEIYITEKLDSKDYIRSSILSFERRKTM